MKTTLTIMLILVAICSIIQAEQPVEIPAADGVDLTPRTGIPFESFTTAWAQIAPQLPQEDTLLDLTVLNANKIEVKTCKKDSHPRGTGGSFVFENIRGNWVKTQSGSWIS